MSEESLADGFEHRKEQYEESPEDEGVDEPRAQPLQELPLAQHDARLAPGAPPHVAAAVRGLPEADDAVEQVGAAGEQAARDCEGCQEETGGKRGAHGFLGGRRQPDTPPRAFLTASDSAGRISCISPITA